MLDWSKIKTIPLKDRNSLESVDDFKVPGSPYEKHSSKDLEELAVQISNAKERGKMVIAMFGAHLIKRGLSLYIIDLLKKGYIKHLATNGAGSIHDFEIALAGKTSEDVAIHIKDGSFGMAEETGHMMNDALKKSNKGYGYAIGNLIAENSFKYKESSIFYNAYDLGIPITVHVAIGTDIIHQHPSCDGASLGQTSYDDFKKFVESVSMLKGGVLLNIGSAVILPEVFLKALSIARNLGSPVNNFTSANFDMIKHYRPTMNVVERPTSIGGKGFNIIGLHQSTIPTLYHYIREHESN